MEDAVVEEIHKSALTGVSSKPLLCTAMGLGPAARGNPMSNPRDAPHSPDPRLSPGAGFKQTRVPAATGETQGKGSKAEIWTGPICSGSHHALVKDGLSAQASWPNSNLSNYTRPPQIPLEFQFKYATGVHFLSQLLLSWALLSFCSTLFVPELHFTENHPLGIMEHEAEG